MNRPSLRVAPERSRGQQMIRYWLAAVRPRTLSIAVVPVLVGSTLAWSETGALMPSVMAATLLAAVLIQAGTNLQNDAADFERGADDPGTRLGPPRATAEGWLSANQVRTGAVLSFGVAFALGGYLIAVGGWPILAVGVASMVAGVAYSSGPRPIAYTGFGELFVWIFFGLVAVSGSYYLQTGGVSQTAVLAGAVIGSPAAAVLVVNNYRDLENDAQVGRKTVAVRFGRSTSRLEFALLMLAPFILVPFAHRSGADSWWWLMPYIMLPRAVTLIKQFWSEAPGPAFNKLLAATAHFQLVLGLLICVVGIVDPAFAHKT